MKIADIPSYKFQIPFGKSAGSGYIRSIPVASQIGITDGAASLTDGFPPLNFQPVGSGGVPPFGQDFNGLLNAMSAWTRWQNSGGLVPYDSGFSTSIGGYPAGSVLKGTSAGVAWMSIVDDNTTNPNTGGAGWIAIATAPAVQSGVWNYAAAGGTANALTVALSPVPVGLATGMSIRVLIGANGNTGAATLNVNGLGAIPIRRMGGGTLIAGDLMAWAVVTLIYIDGAWYLASPTATSLPTGVLTWTSPGTVNWTVPAGVTRIGARVWGGGGGGGSSDVTGNAGAGGNGGSYSEGAYSVATGQVLAITVGAGGAGYVSVAGQDGSPGGTSSVGALLTATGGGPGGGSSQGHAVGGKYGIASGTAGGITPPAPGAGGQIYIGGGYAANASGGGGYPVYGSAGAGAYCSSSSGLSVTAGIGPVYPAGGGGGAANGYGGSAGAPGMVIIEY